MAATSPQPRKQGRNDPCPKCGKKMKKCHGHRYDSSRFDWNGMFLGLSLIGVSILALYIYERAPALPAPNAGSVEAHLELVSAYAAAKPADQWWLATAPPVDSADDLAKVVVVMEEQSQRLRDTLQRHAGINDLTRAIADQFPRVWASYDAGGFTHTVMRSAAEPRLEGALEVCFIPRDTYARQGHPAHFYYRPEWEALMLAGLEMPDGAYAGILLHELGHALRHRQGTLSPTTSVDSETYVAGEVEMHELESAVFDAVSGGEFTAALDAVIDRVPSATDCRVSVLGLNRDDLRRLDSAIGATSAGVTITRTLATHYVYALGSRFISRRVDVAQHQAHRIALYRWIRATL